MLSTKIRQIEEKTSETSIDNNRVVAGRWEELELIGKYWQGNYATKRIVHR